MQTIRSPRRGPFAALPPHVRFLMQHALIGFGLATVFVMAVLWSDAFGIGGLLRGADSHPLPVLLLWFFTGLTFGSVQMGAAVMLLEDPFAQAEQDVYGKPED